MYDYLKLIWDTALGTAGWVGRLITLDEPWYTNYFYGLILISLLVWGLEMIFPWRKTQATFRKDFWLDGFYMFFNFFIFSIVISGIYAVLEKSLASFGLSMTSISLIDLSQIPFWGQLLLFFIILDFVQWFTHVLLHRYHILWQFHKVHHSVEEMGFAAHLRYHWMENILYKPLKTLAVMLLGGFEPEQAYIVHFFAITIGHLNHANIRITWGPLKYVFNNSVMHLWHHAKDLPNTKPNGVNYGISLSIWDYIFKTNYIPHDSPDIALGFKDMDEFPKGFWGQLIYGLKSKSK
jgi:sterol desaturase/sphingolipid hydroxylase (fatty acid hydroxylase superfamily)